LPRNYNAPITDFKNWPRLVQIAWILYDQDGNRISNATHIVKPNGFTIPAAASGLHGITTERANNEGADLVFVLNEFTKQIEQCHSLVAHNISFDEKIVGAEFLRNNMQNVIQTKKRICTMHGSKHYCAIKGPYGIKFPQLAELHYKLFNCNFERAMTRAPILAQLQNVFGS